MKSKFPGYFGLSDKDITDLWNNCIFVFDANILLGLYRYSDRTRDDMLSVIESIQNRCWLPHQSVKEYFNNRLNVIDGQEQSYAEAIKDLTEIIDRFKTSKRHPFLPESTLADLGNHLESVISELKKSGNVHAERLRKDDILDRIEIIFKDGVGESYSTERLAEIAKEGEERYRKNVPPGFKDAKKEDPSDDMRRYGDLILWNQIMDKSKEENKGVIFVSDDRKEDWWLEFKGRTISPRPELVAEFKAVTSSEFYMYATDRFLTSATKYLNSEVSTESVSEIREIRRDEESSRRKKTIDTQKSKLITYISKLDQTLAEAHGRLANLESEAERMREFRNELRVQAAKGPSANRDELRKHLESVSSHLVMVETSMGDTRKEIEYVGAARSEVAVQLHGLDVSQSGNILDDDYGHF